MKQVLITDPTPLFREYLKEKLKEENIGVEVVQGQSNAFTKLISQLHDLVIVNTTDNFDDTIDFLDRKQANANTASIPIILVGPKLSKDQIETLIPYKVSKYFSRPIKFDLFFEAIGRILRTPFSLDKTPAILELHLNENIIFIEAAKGLNREKISLLKYNLTEMIAANKITSPKIVLMMTDMMLNFVDGSNLEFLMDSILEEPHISRKNLKILTMDSFARELIEGHEEYSGIEVTDNLPQIISSLLDGGTAADIQEIVTQRILTPDQNASTGTAEMRFYSENQEEDGNTNSQPPKKLRFAVVDDDPVIRQILQTTFARINADTDLFTSGVEFLNSIEKNNYNLVVMDIFMPGLSGFEILTSLHSRNYNIPIIVYSSATQREVVIQALSFGARSYMIKPQKPEVLLQKVKEILSSAT